MLFGAIFLQHLSIIVRNKGVKYLKTIVVSLALVLLIIGSVLLINQNTISLQTLDSSSLKKLINLDSDESVFYVLDGSYDGVKHRAYLEILQNETNKNNNGLLARIAIPTQNHSFEIAIDDKMLSFALEDDILFLSGVFNGIEFEFHQDSSIALNQIYFIHSKIYNETQVNDRFGDRVIFYGAEIVKPIIINSELNNIHLLNQSISSAKDINQLRENLDSTLRNNMNKYIKDYGFISNTEFLDKDSVGFIDNNILQIDTISYSYTGGAHGNSVKTMQLYDISSGDKIPSGIEDVFNITDDNKAKFLSFLSEYLEPKKDQLFNESLPLTVMPNSFFLSSNGVIFIWNTYEIAPYSSGMIEIAVEFDKLKEWVKHDWRYKYLFYST